MNDKRIMTRSAARLNAFLLVVLLLAANAPFLAAQIPGQQHNKYNVLFIAIDDLRTELGCYGLPYVDSPNLDRLAGQGILFNNHFVQVPTCGASRYALLTGRSPIQSGGSNNNAFYGGRSALSREPLAGAQSMPEMFRRSGYETVCIGKISHTADGRVFAYNGSGDGRPEMPHAWNQLATPFGKWQRGWGIFFAYADGRHREDGNGNKDLYEFKAKKDSDLPDGLLAETAIARLAELKKTGKPFFMGLGFFKPHLPFVATQGDWEAMQAIDVSPPPHPARTDSIHWHASNEFYKYDAPHRKTKPLAADDQIRMRRAYLACVRYVDRQVGKVMNALDANGLADSTIVVVWGDHGWHLGDSAIWGKHTPLERALKSTLMIRVPGIATTGIKTDALAESLDLYPTLIDLCAPQFSETEHRLDGRSLVPVLNGESAQVRDSAISYWREFVSVRTQDYRMIRSKNANSKKRVELYDMRDGPDPIRNLAGTKPEIVSKLTALIPNLEKLP